MLELGMETEDIYMRIAHHYFKSINQIEALKYYDILIEKY